MGKREGRKKRDREEKERKRNLLSHVGTLQSFQAGLPSGLARLSNPHHPHLISLALLVLQVAVGFSPAYLNSNSHH